MTVAYVNTTAELKAVCDVCVTSSSAVEIVRKLPAQDILFIPDVNLGAYVQEHCPEKRLHFLHGGCPVHACLTALDAANAKALHPGAELLAHPECRAEVLAYADYVGSTAGIMEYVKRSGGKEFIIGTEISVAEHLGFEYPDKTFYPLSKKLICPNMKATTLPDVYRLLKEGGRPLEMDAALLSQAAAVSTECWNWAETEKNFRKKEPVKRKKAFERTLCCGINNKAAEKTSAVCRKSEINMLELRHVTYRVKDEQGEKTILNDITLSLNERFVAFTGPNGGGKSTLAKVIAGIIAPTEGQIFWEGEDVTSLSVTERARKGISYAFQQPVRFKGLTVRDLISIAAGKNANISDACAYLSEVGLCARDYLDREVNASLSGGELKRIEIATILARGTKLSVFDEPEAGIDLWSFGNLINVFEKMYRKTQGNILIISHQERILNIADRIVVISGGKVEKSGTKEEILPGLLGAETCRVLTEKL